MKMLRNEYRNKETSQNVSPMDSYSRERIACFQIAFGQRILPPTQLPLLQSVGARPRRAEACCYVNYHILAQKL